MAEKSIKAAQVQTLVNNIKAKFFAKADAQSVGYMGDTQEVESVAIDSSPTNGSDNLVKSGGVFSALSAKIGEAPSDGNQYARKNGGWTVVQSSGGVTDHAQLSNLDYEHSGHTGFQPTISDLSTIRSGASAGATAYQKPSSGIPASDLASGVVPSVPVISTNIVSDKSSNVKTASPKAVYDEIHPANQSSIPSGGMKPNVLYNLGTITANTTMTLASPTDSSVPNHYYFTFNMGSTVRTITWDSKITSWLGGSAPAMNANKHYEISVLNGVGVAMEI